MLQYTDGRFLRNVCCVPSAASVLQAGWLLVSLCRTEVVALSAYEMSHGCHSPSLEAGVAARLVPMNPKRDKAT